MIYVVLAIAGLVVIYAVGLPVGGLAVGAVLGCRFVASALIDKGLDRYRARNENFVRVWAAQDDHDSTVQEPQGYQGRSPWLVRLAARAMDSSLAARSRCRAPWPSATRAFARRRASTIA